VPSPKKKSFYMMDLHSFDACWWWRVFILFNRALWPHPTWKNR